MNATSNEPTTQPAAAGEEPAIRLKRILVPIDFSDCSKKALQYAKPFAEQFHAEIVLLHVSSVNYMVAEGFGGVDLPTLRADLIADAEKQLGEIAKVIESKDAAATLIVREGRAASEIVELAKEEKIDLIVMATHGYSSIKHVLLGSVTENVVRHAPCPVLAVRERKHDFVAA